MRTAFFLLLVAPMLLGTANGQIRNLGVLKIAAGTTVSGAGEYRNGPQALLNNDGALHSPALFMNENGGTVSGDGSYTVGGDWVNDGTFTAGNSTVTFDGSTTNFITPGGSPFFNISMQKAAENLIIYGPVQVNGTFNFLADDNYFDTNGFPVTFGQAASVIGFSDKRFFFTGWNGILIKENMAAGNSFTYPVGFSAPKYNPVTLTQGAGASTDALGVRRLPSSLDGGLNGNEFLTGTAGVSWQITENVAGGNNLTMTAQWAAADELNGFDRNDCGLARFGTDWELPPARMGAAAGSGPFSRTASGLTNVGVYTVSGEGLMDRCPVSLKIYIQGAGYDAVTQRQGDLLRAANLLPTALPTTYTQGKFAPIGWQPTGGYSVAPSVFAVTGNDAIVDWVFLFLKNPLTPFSTVQTRPALLQRDGDVVDLDGVSPVKVPASAGPWIIGVGHRNHLSVRTPNAGPLTLLETGTVSYDFTTAQAQAFGTNPMKQVSTGPAVFALWAGNANANLNVRASGPANDQGYLLNTCLNGAPGTVLINQYSNCDLNMNGVVRYTGPSNDAGYLLNSVLGGVSSTVINEQF